MYFTIFLVIPEGGTDSFSFFRVVWFFLEDIYQISYFITTQFVEQPMLRHFCRTVLFGCNSINNVNIGSLRRQKEMNTFQPLAADFQNLLTGAVTKDQTLWEQFLHNQFFPLILFWHSKSTYRGKQLFSQSGFLCPRVFRQVCHCHEFQTIKVWLSD